MHRRTLLAVAALLPAAPAVAQTRKGRDSELQHAAETLAAGKFSLETSKIAVERATDAEVKRFAQAELAEQETVAEVVRSITDAASAVPPPDKPKTERAMELDRLRQLQGQGFDQAYVGLQVDGHGELLRIQERYLSRGKDPSSRAVAMLARGHIREHLAWLEAIRGKTG